MGPRTVRVPRPRRMGGRARRSRWLVQSRDQRRSRCSRWTTRPARPGRRPDRGSDLGRADRGSAAVRLPDGRLVDDRGRGRPPTGAIAGRRRLADRRCTSAVADAPATTASGSAAARRRPDGDPRVPLRPATARRRADDRRAGRCTRPSRGGLGWRPSLASDADAVAPAAWVRDGGRPAIDVRSSARTGSSTPAELRCSLGERELRAALLLPGGREPDAPPARSCSPRTAARAGSGSFATAARYVVSSGSPTGGVAVLVIDGRGTPGRGVALGEGDPPGLHGDARGPGRRPAGAASRWGFLDLERVAIRGWSFGG